MVTTLEILKAMAVTTITARQRITDKVRTTSVTSGVTSGASGVTSGASGVTSGVTIEAITLIIEIMVFTGVSIATYHIDTDAMIAGSKKICIVKI
jgi:hypothetical protein